MPAYAPPAAPAAPTTAVPTGGGGLGALLALAGGVIAGVAVWLPWMTSQHDSWPGTNASFDQFQLGSGNFLVGAGVVAAICGLLLILGLTRSRQILLVLALGGLAAGILACAVVAVAYQKISGQVSVSSSAVPGLAVGMGLYAGIAGGVLAAIGGLLSLQRASKFGVSSAAASSQAAVMALVIVGLGAGAGAVGPTLGNSSNLPVNPTPGPSSGPTASSLIVVPTAQPSQGGPGASASFYTSGYNTPEAAMNQLVNDQQYTYGGDCASADSSADYCSTFVRNSADGGSIYAIGAPGSEAEIYVLVEKVGGSWYVAAWADASSAIPWK